MACKMIGSNSAKPSGYGDLRSSIKVEEGQIFQIDKIVFGKPKRNGKGEICPSATCCGAVSDRLLFIAGAFRF